MPTTRYGHNDYMTDIETLPDVAARDRIAAYVLSVEEDRERAWAVVDNLDDKCQDLEMELGAAVESNNASK